MEDERKRITAYVDADKYVKVKVAIAHADMSLSDWVNVAIDEKLARDSKEGTPPK